MLKRNMKSRDLYEAIDRRAKPGTQAGKQRYYHSNKLMRGSLSWKDKSEARSWRTLAFERLYEKRINIPYRTKKGFYFITYTLLDVHGD